MSKMIVTSNTQEYSIYGCKVWLDKRDWKYRTIIGGRLIEKDSYSDMAYYIGQLQSNPIPTCF